LCLSGAVLHFFMASIGITIVCYEFIASEIQLENNTLLLSGVIYS